MSPAQPWHSPVSVNDSSNTAHAELQETAPPSLEGVIYPLWCGCCMCVPVDGPSETPYSEETHSGNREGIQHGER